jgi:isoleucyl-tRNA synthetase
MLRPVSPHVSFPELEQKALRYWESEKIFERSVRQNEGNQPFVFYEGPPTANGMPHPGHVLTRVIKDVFLRYWTMRGFHVPRRGGWDTHGLPVEVEVEKELGIHGRLEIEAYGVEAFTRKCIDSVFRYIEEWRRLTQRIGFWVDLDQAYVTFHQSYVQSVWWALSELFKKGLLYQDYKVVWWWPQGGTALSAGEVGQGYKTVDDPSVVVKFALRDEPRTYLLAWTTTPWTLPSNVALAVHAKEVYVTMQTPEGERWVVAEARVGEILQGRVGCEVVERRTGEQLAGASYTPLFSYATPEGGRAYEVVTADFVTLDSGTGIVHVAPAFGEDDFRVAKEKGLGFLQLVRPDGTFCDAVTDFRGMFCKDADRDIIRHLKKQGSLVSEQAYRHEYPFCWRADQDPLIQYARRSWFVRTSQFVDELLDNNAHVHWEPEHIRDGRFGAFLRNNVDWALSRERYWGTPLPIWVNDVTGSMQVVASTEEILQRNPQAFDSFHEARRQDPSLSEHLMVHKPWIDAVTWTVEGEPGVYRRVPEVIDCWFDSGCMPFAQLGYPHRAAESLGQNFPADFITEAVDQTRGWFYSLLAISTLLFTQKDKPHPFRNCVVLGHISDEKGQKLSKSKKNYDDPMKMIEELGGDAVRWSLYVSCVPGQNTRFFAGAASEAVREFLLKIWNVYSFFVTYARMDGWKPSADERVAQRSDMDRWILAELDETVRFVCTSLEAYRSHPAARRIHDFVDALSNWYVRRGRSRFWAEGNSADKQAAFRTLYEVLVELSTLVAPFTPFLAEELYQNLVLGFDAEAPRSVHLTRYPESRAERRDDALRARMNVARSVVALGQRVRATEKIRVRQPLSKAVVVVATEEQRQAVQQFGQAIADELNVHDVVMTQDPHEYVKFVLVPNFRVLGPKVGKVLPEIKSALARADGSVLHQQLERHGSIRLELSSTECVLTSEDIEIRLQAKEGFQAAAEHGQVVVLDTTVTRELRHEGLAREFVNRVQKARKDMNLAFEQRVHIDHDAQGELAEALTAHKEYVQGETLALSLRIDPALTELSAHHENVHAVEIEGEPVRVRVTLAAS